MDFPQRLQVRLLDRTSAKPVPRLLVTLRLSAPQGNDYAVGPRFSDGAGRVIFTRREVEAEIRESRHYFPDTYLSDLSECSPLISVQILSCDEIESFIEACELWAQADGRRRLSSAHQLQFRASANRFYVALAESINLEKLPKEPAVDVWVQQRLMPTSVGHA